MSSRSPQASTSRSVILAIVIAAAAIWGLYVWKFQTEDRQNGNDIVTLAPDSGSQSRFADQPLLPLRAERQPATGDQRSSDTYNRSDKSAIVTDLPLVSTGPVSIDEPARARFEPATIANAADNTELSDKSDAISSVGTSVDADVLAGRQALERGQLLDARTRLSRAFEGRLSNEQRERIRNELTTISDKLIFSKTVAPGDPLTKLHEIASGESVYVLARRHKVTMNLLQQINELERPEFIRAGQRLKIIEGPFDAVIRKSQHRMDIFLKGQFIRSYRVGLGAGAGTPLGKWEVTTKLTNPEWTDPRSGQYYAADDPQNPIGEYWIGLDCIAGDCIGDSGYGIHGTIEPESIGADMSMGCVRLLPDDIREVHQLLVRRHSTVDIVP